MRYSFAGVSSLLGTVLLAATAAVGEQDRAAIDPFALDGSQNIMDECHFGIVNGKISAGVLYRDLFAWDGLWAPPYVSSDFRFTVKVLDKPVPSDRYTWHPYYVERSGRLDDIAIETTTMLIPGSRAGLLEISLRNSGNQDRTVPVSVAATGTLDDSRWWEFAAPASKTPTVKKVADNALVLEQDKLAIVLRGSEPVQWDVGDPSARANVTLTPGGIAKLHFTIAIGPAEEAKAACAQIASDPAKALAEAQAAYVDRVRQLLDKLPRLESDNEALNRFYNRSLSHLLMNVWDVPEFILNPYYSTGSVRGGCVCNYLWNLGENWEILPIYDPEASKTHIKKFLAVDMTKHFAFEPTTGKAFGPWYMVNQEKIIGLIYYYVKITGDMAFLDEVVDGHTVFEHVLINATHLDDPSKPVALIDYGPSNSHLELRRGIPYNHVMPDLNARRYQNYLLAAELAEAVGKPAPQLVERAGQLKALLKETLWNPKTRWFDFIDEKGNKDTRYTVQMFKLFNSTVLDAEQEAGLLAHLNSEEEFLSEFGLHSLAKGDVAYDPADVDNGGPGACTCFAPQIIERLYKAGHPADAENVLKRILWWGERLPYWGDSIVADKIDYRHDTPLQCTSDGATAAQCITFGMFGVRADINGDISVHPQPPSFAKKIAIKNIRIRGRVIDIAVDGTEYEVKDGDHQLRAPLGQTVLIRRE